MVYLETSAYIIINKNKGLLVFDRS